MITKTEQIRESKYPKGQAMTVENFMKCGEYDQGDFAVIGYDDLYDYISKLAEQREEYEDREASLAANVIKIGTDEFNRGKFEQKQEIIDWCKKRCKDNIRINGTDKWNGDMEEIIEVLKRWNNSLKTNYGKGK